MNMLGTTGPLSSARGFGFQLVAYSGFTYISGWPDRVPAQPFGPYTDWIAPRYAASALLMALIHRNKTGEGACIDLSQHEAGINFLIPMLLDRQLSGRQKERNGNVHPCFCPHGVYPCKGKERWVAICITNDEQWKDFSDISGEDWAGDKEFASSHGRKQNQEIIDSLVSQWSRKHFSEEITTMLQEKRIPAGVVQNSRDLVNDPQLKARRAIWFLDHESVGKHAVFRQGFILSQNPPPHPTAAPRLGEHTYHICKEILQMPDEEIATLLDEGILQIEV
jgi:benzylsuccinate CoA-transferase BbsF subunit